MNNLPTPQKKPNIAEQQKMMDLIKRKGQPQDLPQIEKAKEQLKQILTANKIDPNTLIQAGDLAFKALRDPTMYQMALNMLIKNNILTPEQAKISSKETLLGTAMIAGKLAQKIVKEG
jgi:Spy/CpxP family protein refolding chaperone